MLLAAVLGAGCGDGGRARGDHGGHARVASEVLVSVDGIPITKDTYDHWVGVTAANSASRGSKPTIPLPPKYTACIASLKAKSKPANGQTAPGETALKSNCEQSYKALQQKVLGFLISSQWVLGEASSLGVKLTEAEVKSEFEKYRKTVFPRVSELDKYLALSGMTVSDLLLRFRLNLLSSKIQQRVVKSADATGARAAYAKFVSEFRKRWEAKTHCRAGYVVQDCKGHRLR
jgi:foldase protein PrsA